MKRRSYYLLALAMVVGLSSLTGCSGNAENETSAALETTQAVASETEPVTEVLIESSMAEADGGTLLISVNPEIAVEYDDKGIVTAVSARNNDAFSIINKCEGLIGTPTREAVSKLVTAIGESGYFVEEATGTARQIVIEIEAGSSIPYEGFMDEVVDDVRACVSTHNWSAPLDVHNESDYGLTDYVDTDYGPSNDGVTDYAYTNYGDDGVTDYGNTDYGVSIPVPQTQAPAPTQPQTQAPPPTQPAPPAPAPAPAYSDYGNSGYGDSAYGNSGYGDSGYGDSGYDD